MTRTPAAAIALTGLSSGLSLHAGAPTSEAQTKTATLTLRADEPGPQISRHIYGHFAEHPGRCTHDGLWVGPDSPTPNTRGIRNDVNGALDEIEIPHLRGPGGCFAGQYPWEDGVGPTDERPDRVNEVHHDATFLLVDLETDYALHGGHTIPALSASASRDEQARLHPSLVDMDPRATAALKARLQGAAVSSVPGTVLTAAELGAHSAVAAPDEVKPEAFGGARRSGSDLSAELPPRSVVVLSRELTLGTKP